MKNIVSCPEVGISNTKQHLENAIYLLGLMAIFGVAVWLRGTLPPIPFLNNDSWGYLQPSVSSLATGNLEPTYRGFLYPSILWGILKLYPHFSAIVVLQHGAGLLAGVLLIIAWERMRIFLPSAIWVRRAHRLGGWIMLAVYTFSNASILYEHSIRPEAVFPLTAILCILVATEFSRQALTKSSNVAGISPSILAFLLVVLACAAYYLKPAWGVAALGAIAPIAIAWAAAPSICGLLPAGLGFCVAFTLFTIPERWVHHTVPGSNLFLPQTLVCSHGEIIYNVLKNDASLPPSDPRRTASDLLLPHFERAIQHPTQINFGYSRLHPDDLMYRGAMGALGDAYQNDSKRIAALCYDYYRRAWQQDPAGMLYKIASQIFYFYCPWKSVTYHQGIHFDLRRHLQNSLQVLKDRPSFVWPPYQEYRSRVRALVAHPPHASLPPLLVSLATLLNPLYMPIALLAAIAALGILFSGNPLLSDLRISALWTLYLLSYNFAMTLTVAVVHMMTVDRYHFAQTIFSILSQSFAAIFLVYATQRFLQTRASNLAVSTQSQSPN